MSLIGCGPADSPATAEIAESITNGTMDDGDPAVVALLFSGQAYCTGTVIADRWVLTAAHCLQPPMSPSEVYIGKNPVAAGVRMAVARTIVHPQFNFFGLENDIGLVELVDPAPLTPLPLMKEPLDQAWIGSMIRLVGFGSSSTDKENAIKRSGTAKVSAVDPQKFTLQPAPSQPCLADSGAPILHEAEGLERVVGVSSSGDAHCQEYAHAVRVDAFVDGFILPAISGSARAYGCQPVPDRAPGPSILVLALALLRAVARRRRGQ
jgi:secreted trypsin-like serine protease